MNVNLLIASIVTASMVGAAAIAADAKKDDKKPAPVATEKKADAAKPAGDVAKDPKDVRDKLLKLSTLEQAFKQADYKRKQLAAAVLQDQEKLKKATTDDEKKKIQAALDDASKNLQATAIAMDVCFGIGNRRTYEFDEVSSTVYLKVGTVEEAFARTVNTRDALKKFIVEQTAAKDAEKDQAKKDEIQKKIDAAQKQFQLVAASLQLVFNISQQREYTYDPKDASIYLKISDNEVEKLKAEAAKLQEEAKAKADAAKSSKP